MWIGQMATGGDEIVMQILQTKSDELKIVKNKVSAGTLTCRIQAQGGITAKGGKKGKTKGWIVIKDGKSEKPRAE